MQRKKRKRLEWQNGEEITSTNKQTNKIYVQINRQYTKTSQVNELTDDDSTDRHNINRQTNRLTGKQTLQRDSQNE